MMEQCNTCPEYDICQDIPANLIKIQEIIVGVVVNDMPDNVVRNTLYLTQKYGDEFIDGVMKAIAKDIHAHDKAFEHISKAISHDLGYSLHLGKVAANFWADVVELM